VEQKKIVIVNDLLPEEQRGAASIALGIANYLNTSFSSQYWSTSTNARSATDNHNHLRILQISENLAKQSSLGLRHKLRIEYFSLHPLIWICRQIKTEKPTAISVQQIGNRIPRAAIPLFVLLRIPVVCTLHDFGWIVPRKLFPDDLSVPVSDLPPRSSSGNAIKVRNKLKVNGGSRLKQLIIQIRLSVNRRILNSCSSVIAISDLQAQIYESFGFRIDRIIPNNVGECKCADLNDIQRQDNTLLFAGRAYAKGLDQVLELVDTDPELTLYLAGPQDLQLRAATRLKSSQYRYFGDLSHEELFRLIHEVGFVVVLSECFDVYPTITLEAIAHGALVLTNRNTGNHHLVSNISPELVIGKISNIDFKEVQRNANVTRASLKFEKSKKKVSDGKMFEAYRDVFNRILTH
jgi:hypothetical protein